MRVIDWWNLLEFIGDTGVEISRAGLLQLVEGYAACPRPLQAKWLVRRLEQQGWIQRQGRGQRARFRVLANDPPRPVALAPRSQWARSWDHAWRVVSFDVPEVKRRERQRLWKALRARKLGFLQRSVWIWPDDVQGMLAEITQAEGIPNCFCGFEASRLLRCDDHHLVESAWDFVEITRCQAAYLSNRSATVRQIKVTHDPIQVAAYAREEQQAYTHAFAADPLLPRELLPSDYQGWLVQDYHDEIRDLLRRQFQRLAL